VQAHVRGFEDRTCDYAQAVACAVAEPSQPQNQEKYPSQSRALFSVEYVQSHWNLISTELLRWNRNLAKTILFGPVVNT